MVFAICSIENVCSCECSDISMPKDDSHSPRDDEFRKLASRPDCTEEELKAAYRQLAQQLHPDHGGDAERFQSLQGEYEAALKRIREPTRRIVNTDYVPRSPVRRRRPRKFVQRAAIASIILVAFAIVLPRELRLGLLALLPALVVFLIVPLVMASMKPHISGIIFLVLSPVLMVTIVGIGLSEPVRAILGADGAARDQNYVLLAIVFTAISLFASTLLGMLFSVSSQH